MKEVILLFLTAACFGSRVKLEYDNGSLNILTINGTVMVDQLDLKQAIASLRSELSSTVEANLHLNATIRQLVQESTRSALNQYFPERYFDGASS
jgi:hypothetical protein